MKTRKLTLAQLHVNSFTTTELVKLQGLQGGDSVVDPDSNSLCAPTEPECNGTGEGIA